VVNAAASAGLFGDECPSLSARADTNLNFAGFQRSYTMPS
jgi:hypothetical protein